MDVKSKWKQIPVLLILTYVTINKSMLLLRRDSCIFSLWDKLLLFFGRLAAIRYQTCIFWLPLLVRSSKLCDGLLQVGHLTVTRSRTPAEQCVWDHLCLMKKRVYWVSSTEIFFKLTCYHWRVNISDGRKRMWKHNKLRLRHEALSVIHYVQLNNTFI